MSSPDRLLYRPIAAADLAVLGPWLRAAGLGVPDHVGDDRWGKRVSTDPRIVCLAAHPAGGDPVGFVRLDVAPDRTAEVTVVVAPRARRQGIGSGLLERALTEARRRGLRRLHALVQPDNRAAWALFGNAGFEPTGAAVRGFVALARTVHRAERRPPLEISP